MIKREDDGLWVILEETIACHHDEVFSCLTTAEGLTRWLPVAATVMQAPSIDTLSPWTSSPSSAATSNRVQASAPLSAAITSPIV